MPKWMELVFVVRVSIEDSFIVLAWSPDLLTEREMEME